MISSGGVPPFGRPPDGVAVRLVDPGSSPGATSDAWFSKNVRHYLDGPPWLYRSAWHHERVLSEALEEELAAFPPDLVQIEHEELVGLLSRIPSTTPAVLDMHNVLLQVQWQNLGKPLTWEWFKACLELGVLARAERRAMAAARHTVATSPSNLRLLRRLRRTARTTLVPNSIDARYFRRNGSRAPAPVVVFTGSFHYPPNREAADLMIGLFPDIRRRVPDAELRLVGQRMPDDVRARAAAVPGVTVVGEVDDVRPEIESAWLAVAPLVRGSGSPLKVVEALSMETPVAGTPFVASALQVDERDGFVQATLRDLPGVIASVLEDEPRRLRLGHAGRRAVERRFERTTAAAALERVWLSTAGQ